MTTPLNSPLEISVRVLALVVEGYPDSFDLDRLVLLDHGLLNSEDFGGPPSLHPKLPIRNGQFALKRTLIRSGLKVLFNAELVEPKLTEDGIFFAAKESAGQFLGLLQADYVKRLRERARWATSTLGQLSDSDLRSQLRLAAGHWNEEFTAGGAS